MRFHHSTRRGRHHSAPPHHHLSSSTRWAQLNHCRETNVYFNRRLPIEYPAAAAIEAEAEAGAAERLEDPVMLSSATGIGANNKQQQMINSTVQQQTAKKSSEGNGSITMDLESLREKLIVQVQKHPFWSNKAAKKMQINNVKRRNIYIYELESYCERRDLEWNFEPYRGGLSAHSVTPYRGHELPAAISSSGGSLSQPATPLNKPAGSSQFVWSVEAGNTSSTPIHSQQTATSKSSVGRSLSNKSTPPIANNSLSDCSYQATKSNLLYEPVSARLQHLIPSPENVWSIDVMNSQKQQQRGRRHLTGPGCVSSELPNSSFVKRCHGCQGKGKLKCNSCHGVGYEVCLSCSGKGTTRSYSASSSARASACARSCDRSSSNNNDRDDPDTYHGGGGAGAGSGSATDGNSRNSRYANGGGDHSNGNSMGGFFSESCGTCHGAGQKRCWVCAGKSYNNCPGCAGLGNLRCFLTMTVSWLSHCDDVIINNSDQIIPKERLRVCSGLLLVDQVEDRLRPLNLAAVATETSSSSQSSQQQQDSLNCCRAEAEQLQLASKHLLEKHRNTYKGEKFLKQRHKVTQIECHIVRYEWKQRHGQFVIYGEERKVYIGKYPFKSFCNLI